MLRLVEGMAFVGIDHHLRLHAQRLKRAPEFVGLWGGALAVAVSHYDQSRRLHLLDEVDRGHFRVDRGIVVDRRAEVRDHPGVDGVLAVVTLPVGDSGAGHRGKELIGTAAVLEICDVKEGPFPSKEGALAQKGGILPMSTKLDRKSTRLN